MGSMLTMAYSLNQKISAALVSLQALALLGARLFVGHAFFLSGLTKLRDWDITLALFADE